MNVISRSLRRRETFHVARKQGRGVKISTLTGTVVAALIMNKLFFSSWSNPNLPRIMECSK